VDHPEPAPARVRYARVVAVRGARVLAAQVRTDGLPMIPVVERAEENLRAHVEWMRRERRERERRDPGIAVFRGPGARAVASHRPGRHLGRLAGLLLEAGHVASQAGAED